MSRHLFKSVVAVCFFFTWSLLPGTATLGAAFDQPSVDRAARPSTDNDSDRLASNDAAEGEPSLHAETLDDAPQTGASSETLGTDENGSADQATNNEATKGSAATSSDATNSDALDNSQENANSDDAAGGNGEAQPVDDDRAGSPSDLSGLELREPARPATEAASQPAELVGSERQRQDAQDADEAEPLPPAVPDLHLQGEYEGPIAAYRESDAWIYDYAGVQVMCDGRGNFSGVYYPGGLPGSGWSRRLSTRLNGRREGNRVMLEGERLRVVVEDGKASLRRPDGQAVGTLERVLRRSGTLGQPAPAGAIVLFDGTDTQHFRNGRINEAGNLMAGADLIPVFRDYTLHVEFRVPFLPENRSQGRGNSGVYLQSRYEVQILDSFGLEGAFNECGALYRYQAPDLNMCLPPRRWQTFDITFRSPRFNRDGEKIANAWITVRHNNVVVHDNFEVLRKTGAGRPEGPELLPIRLQDHGDPVEFRNIWIIDHDRPALSDYRRAGNWTGLPGRVASRITLPSIRPLEVRQGR